jgi:hypothetical protein
MLKRIFNYIIIMTGALLILASCEDKEDEIKTFSSLVDVSNSSLVDHKHSMGLLFSTDGGETFVDYPVIKVGQSYKVKAVDLGTHTDITVANCFDIDWSASDPKPVSPVTSDVAEFLMGESNNIRASVTDHVTAYAAEGWVGTFTALEDYGSAHWGPYEVQFTQDVTIPNRFHLDNFYDSGLPAYIEFDGAAGTVKFPDGQSPNGKPLTASSGTFNQCTGEATINLNYDGGDWIYHFTKN